MLLMEDYGMAPLRMKAFEKSESGFEEIETTTRKKVKPPYDTFYRTVKDMMK